MAETVTQVRIFVASPRDVKLERDALKGVVDELNTTVAPFIRFSLHLVRWETHCQPSMGRPQGVINSQIGDYDIFVGIMWHRFGTPTGKAESGTEEEFRLAFNFWEKRDSPWILFYFCQAPFMPRSVEECEQMSSVLRFRLELQPKGLAWEYDASNKFADTIRPHIMRILLTADRVSDASASGEPPEKSSLKSFVNDMGSMDAKWIQSIAEEISPYVELSPNSFLAVVRPILQIHGDGYMRQAQQFKSDAEAKRGKLESGNEHIGDTRALGAMIGFAGAMLIGPSERLAKLCQSAVTIIDASGNEPEEQARTKKVVLRMFCLQC